MRAASDVGGTFTDLVYYDYDATSGKSGPVRVAKADTTPPNFEQGVMDSIHKAGLKPAEMTFFAHGSTLVNAEAKDTCRRHWQAKYRLGVY